MLCNMNCLECTFKDCVNDSPATEQERKQSSLFDKDIYKITGIDMTRYIHNRIDKDEYKKALQREYDKKRDKTPNRKEQKKQQYLKHRDKRLKHQAIYYREHREECIARQKAYYEAHREEINAKRRVVNKAIEVYGDYSLRKIKGRFYIKKEQGVFYAFSLDKINWVIRARKKNLFSIYAHPQDVVKQLDKLNKGGV